MSTVQIEIPEEVLISLKETPETISRELRILAAVKLFELVNYHQDALLS
jgi:hypothetical protein